MSRRRVVLLSFPVLLLILGPASPAAQGKPDPTKFAPTRKGRVDVPKAGVRLDDGDSMAIDWGGGVVEQVRILGIDTPEVMHLEHGIPYDQPFGTEARGFLRGAVAACGTLSLLRSGETDPFGRTLGYVFVDEANVSVLLLRARLAVENVSYFGDNGLPEPAAHCLAAAKQAGPVAFEKPHRFRKRMRALSEWLKAQGKYPGGTPAQDPAVPKESK